MKGLILAAGKGTRLKPLTLTRPKPLLPIAGKSLLEHNLDNLVGAGIQEIGVVVNPQCTQISEALSHYPASLEFIQQPTLAGTADALYQARDFIGDDNFVLVFGDNLTNASVSQLITVYNQSDVAGVLGVFDGGDPRKHAVIQVEDGRIIDIEERPAHPKSTLTSAGMFVLEPSIFQAIEAIEPSPSGEYYLPDALRLILKQYSLGYAVIKGWRINVNTPRDMIMALGLTLNEENGSPASVAVSESANLGDGVVLEGIVWIGSGCHIENNVHLENAICLDGARVGKESTIRWAILEENTIVPRRTRLSCRENPVVYANGSELIS
ncbi:MAG: NTP transferase domain-containing protein [Armatimonadetes bacterium]|nr:NTP transferase domain-containing protein [Armatimonadota bacterium]